jgi:hypothetical protein
LLFGVAAGLLAVPAALSAGSPATVAASIIAAAQQQRSLHYVSHASGGGSSVTQVSDVAADRGIQRITYTENGQTGHVTVVVVRSAVYIRGDEFALRTYMSLPAEEARSYAGAWVRVPPSNRLYRAAAADVTLPSFVSDLRLTGPFAAAPQTLVGGVHAAGVSGRDFSAPATLYYVPGSRPLPVEEVVRAQGGSSTVVISGWNENVDVTAPRTSRALGPVVTA